MKILTEIIVLNVKFVFFTSDCDDHHLHRIFPICEISFILKKFKKNSYVNMIYLWYKKKYE
mgnify:CR=1 FL=1